MISPPQKGDFAALRRTALSPKVPVHWTIAMNRPSPPRPRRIVWRNVLTVVSAAILISAEVFGAAFAGSWAIANLLALGMIGARILDALFVLCGIAVMVQFVRKARTVEPFTSD
jgi:hypothetical protein